MRGKQRIPKEESQKVIDFFKHKYIIPIILDRELAEKARDLVWDHDVDPKDAIHVASAIRAEVDVMDTFDEKLLNKNGEIGDPPLRIGKPDIPFQTEMFEEESEE